MAVILTEGRLSFEFPGDAIKFDEDPFFRDYYSRQPQAKGVDFLAVDEEAILFIEVKDCLHHESENRWRIGCDNRTLHKICKGQDVGGRESLDIEVSKKVASSITCLYGAMTKSQLTAKAEPLSEFWQRIIEKDVQGCTDKIFVILMLEGEFGTHSTPKSKQMKDIEESMKNKLKWLNCKVSVVDMSTMRDKYFSVTAN